MRSLYYAALLATTSTWAAPSFAQTVDCATENALLKQRVLELEQQVMALKGKGPAVVELAAPATVAAAPQQVLKDAAGNTITRSVVVAEEVPYSRSGCRKSFFERLPYAKWQDVDRWTDLENGMSPAEVEAILGIEHFNVAGGNTLRWDYGKCGESVSGQVLFTNGKLSGWRVPNS